MVRSTGSSTLEKQIKLFVVVVSFIHSLSRDLAVSRTFRIIAGSLEYGWLASQRSTAVCARWGLTQRQRTEQNRGAAVTSPVEIRSKRYHVFGYVNGDGVYNVIPPFLFSCRRQSPSQTRL